MQITSPFAIRCVQDTLNETHREYTSLTLSQKSPIFPQNSPIFPQKSHVFPQKSPIFPQRSPIFPQKSPIFPQKSPIFPPKSPIFPHKSPIFPQKSTVDKCRSPLPLASVACEVPYTRSIENKLYKRALYHSQRSSQSEYLDLPN